MPEEPWPPEFDKAKGLAEMLIAFDPNIAEQFGHWLLELSIGTSIAEGRDRATIAKELGLTVDDVARYDPEQRVVPFRRSPIAGVCAVKTTA